MEDVSVIVRSIGRESLQAALESLAMQEGVSLEVVVVAASGPDHPTKSLACGCHHLRFVACAKRLARAPAANAGLDAATCAEITFLDDDDCFLGGHVEALHRALQDAPDCGLVHSYADAVFSDGRHERFGRPASRLSLYERNAIHLSTAVFRRSLVAAGARFDEALDIHEDWDFVLQLAQLTRFTFVPTQTFVWHADRGDSGAGAGRDQDDARFALYRDRIYAKWASARDALHERVTALLAVAVASAARGDLDAATLQARAVLDVEANDPHALNLLAMLARRRGKLGEARELQELAVAVRPDDPALIYNLALLAVDQHDVAHARACCERALQIAPAFTAAGHLLRRLTH